ncbi:hypothetical protein CANCADRAFT_125727 [Tortispora caseinolytica NRRL Y-17796]|uniref:Fatty acid hydroxylase domain-containing protein n=1 Tax=Tortispora caseinolytica NRRL Y-17796 TaxID=767744 RepID=A0A1E4TA45_9ASCO|nr:hypothetical protein CANCADRAFT_125727 [Tortispora caseinolytica NRRL Y-17796]
MEKLMHVVPPEYAGNTFSQAWQNVGALDLPLMQRLWATWYAYFQNDSLATGLMIFCVHEIFYFGRCLPWMLIDVIPYFRRWKIQDQKIPSQREQWACLATVLLTHFTVELPQIWSFDWICGMFGLSASLEFPSFITICYQVAMFFIIEDAWHYWNHRALHWGPLYRWIHKMHHKYSAPFGLAAEYASPIEVMILGLGTIGPPIVWCYITKNLHLITVYVWVILRLFQAVDAHSGYEFPWSLHHFLPFWAGAEHHDEHHQFFIGNYASSFRWWDYVLDTNAGPKAKADRKFRAAQKAKKLQ